MKIDKFDGKYRFLSNFYESPITVDGYKFPTVEHAYQFFKSSSRKWRELIQDAKTPGEAKRLGRQCPMIENWNQIRNEVMLKCLREKFKIPELAEKLKNTKDAELIEGNAWNDTYWGVCNGVGENHLGKLLMQVREELNK